MHWLCRMGGFLSSSLKDANHLCHHIVEKWYETCTCMFPKKIQCLKGYLPHPHIPYAGSAITFILSCSLCQVRFPGLCRPLIIWSTLIMDCNVKYEILRVMETSFCYAKPSIIYYWMHSAASLIWTHNRNKNVFMLMALTNPTNVEAHHGMKHGDHMCVVELLTDNLVEFAQLNTKVDKYRWILYTNSLQNFHKEIYSLQKKLVPVYVGSN